MSTSSTVYEMGVWTKIWRGVKKVRDNQDAKLKNLAQRRGDTIGSWTYKNGWTEEWLLESGEVHRYTRRSPTPQGFKLVALGIREVEIAELGSWKEVCQVWTHGDMPRLDAFNKTGIIEHRYEWLF